MSQPNVISRVTAGLFGSNGTLHSTRVIIPNIADARSERERFAALRAYRDNNRLYDELARVLTAAGVGRAAIKGLRNPTNAAIEFYPATLWPGALPDALPVEFPENARNTDAKLRAIHQVWEWSNWNTNKQVFARNLPTDGEQWLKVATRSDAAGNVTRVYHDLVAPECVTEFDKDERGFLTFIRLDIPQQRRVDGKTEAYIHTEVWDKAAGTYRAWQHKHDGRQIDQLGTPDVEEDIRSFGFDFLPFVHCKFIDDGDPRGRALIEPALDKIDEANQMVTRLHQLLFRYGEPDRQVISTGTDPDGLPLPPARFEGDDMPRYGPMFYRPPSNTRIEDILSDVNFQAHRESVNDMMQHLEQTDLVELIWSQIADAPELSGKAIRLMLTAPIAKLVEVRGNAEAALVRANQMAMTIGVHHGLFDEAIGTYDNGDFDHWFEERTVVPLSEEEQATIDKTNAETAVLRMTVGYPEDRMLEDLGMTEAEVKLHRESQPGSAATMDESGGPGSFDRGFVGGES